MSIPINIIKTGDMLDLFAQYPDAKGPGYMVALVRLGTGLTVAELENMPYHQFAPLLNEVLEVNRLLVNEAKEANEAKKTALSGAA